MKINMTFLTVGLGIGGIIFFMSPIGLRISPKTKDSLSAIVQSRNTSNPTVKTWTEFRTLKGSEYSGILEVVGHNQELPRFGSHLRLEDPTGKIFSVDIRRIKTPEGLSLSDEEDKIIPFDQSNPGICSAGCSTPEGEVDIHYMHFRLNGGLPAHTQFKRK